MTDQELLEAAARAYGDPHIKPGQPDFTRWIGRNEDLGCDEMVRWNPLTDDGDALRLAVKLRMGVTHNDPRSERRYVRADAALFVAPIFESFTADEEFEDENERPAATRRAIVRAAAAMAHPTPTGVSA